MDSGNPQNVSKEFYEESLRKAPVIVPWSGFKNKQGVFTLEC
jgi:hypothetical protein